MTKVNQDFTIRRGESRTIFVDVDQVNGQPFNPTGATFQWWAAKSAASLATGDGVFIKKGSVGSGLSGVTVANNEQSQPIGVNIELEKDDTKNLSPNYYYHELKVFLSDGDVSTAMTGTMIVKSALDMSAAP